MQFLTSLILVVVVFYAASTSYAADATPQQDRLSIYQFESTWLDQNAAPIQLDALEGKLRLVAFVYTYCEHTCPIIVSQLKLLLAELPAEQRDQVMVTLITLDPDRDTPSQLKRYMQDHQLDTAHWTMLHGAADDVRVLANLFGVKYKPMQAGELAHSNMITLVDTEGVIQYQLKGLNSSKEQMLEVIAQLATPAK